MAASKRIQKELKKCYEEKKHGNLHDVFYDEKSQTLQITFIIQEGLYKGKKYICSICFKNKNGDYPFSPPICKFETPIWHPNISLTGQICVNILKTMWSPALGVVAIINSIIILIKEPNVEDPLNSHAAYEFKNDIEKYKINIDKYYVDI